MPYRQGDLDSLCGLYCVVNAIRFAAAPPLRIGETQSKDLINHLARALGPDFLQVFDEGINELIPTLRAADEWLRENHGRRLRTKRPYRFRAPDSPEAILRTIDLHLIRANSAVIVSNVEHWTVVERVTAKRLVLLDSYDRRFLKFANSDQNPNADKIILPHRVILLRITTA